MGAEYWVTCEWVVEGGSDCLPEKGVCEKGVFGGGVDGEGGETGGGAEGCERE